MIVAEPSAEQAADVIAINHLAVAYAEAVCRFEIEEACEVYAPDGVLSSPTTEDAIGPAAIAALIRETVAPFDFIFQTVHLGLVHVDGDRAAARFPITEWGRRTSDGASVQFLGVYDDDVVRTPDGWRFARRRLVPRTLGKPASFTGRVHDLSGLRARLEPDTVEAPTRRAGAERILAAEPMPVADPASVRDELDPGRGRRG